MDRPEPGLIKWSPNPNQDSFVHVNLTHRVVQLYEPTGHARHGQFEYRKLSRHEDFPPLTTYDWSPSGTGLVAVGTSSGVVNLLKVDDNSNAYLELKLKVQRPCHAVAFNTGNLLAVGLERVRNDQSLHIWDVNRLTSADKSVRGFPMDDSSFIEPFLRSEPSVIVSSIKFFEDNPQTLVIGIRNHGLRVLDLRDPNTNVINYQTKCNNNLAIDYADQNYFASTALDQPAVLVWDRRVTQRSAASEVYLQAIDTDDVPWGASLRLDRAIDLEPSQFDDKNSLIRSVRFNRDNRGLLAVLSRTGQLKVMNLQKEFASHTAESRGSPELLEVRKSFELDLTYADPERKNDRIVSFDWVTLNSPSLAPRVIVLRANGNFDILEKPCHASEHVYKMVPWQAPYRGIEEGSSYHSLMEFEHSQYLEMMASLLIKESVSGNKTFGSQKPEMVALLQRAQLRRLPGGDPVVDLAASTAPLPTELTGDTRLSEKLRALRKFYEENLKEGRAMTDDKRNAPSPWPSSDGKRELLSCRQVHETLLVSNYKTLGFPKAAQAVLDHIPLLRAKQKYLFDSLHNREVVADDPWLRDLWNWVYGAENAALDDGMIIHGLDLSYMGVAVLWANDLGGKPKARLLDIPAPADWEHAMKALAKKRNLPAYNGVKSTSRPALRQVCMEACRWGFPTPADFDEAIKSMPEECRLLRYTMYAAHALFAGNWSEAIDILKEASPEHPELLFVSLALQLVERGDHMKEKLEFDATMVSTADPYLRAISTFIATNDWEVIANQESLPVRERTFVALRYFDDEKLTAWLHKQVLRAIHTGDIEGIVLTGITDSMVDIFAKYIEKYNDFQTATLVLSIGAPRYVDDYRCQVWRNAYRAYLQRHKAFYQRTKFEVESTKLSKSRGGAPTIKPPSRQIALRCVYCDAEYELTKAGGVPPSTAHEHRNPLMASNINAGVSCPNCGRHLPRCVVCLEVVGVPRSDKPEASPDPEIRSAAKFPTFCLKCEHVLHLDHARQWFARHAECPVPECRCRCNFRANPELNYA